MQMDFLASVRKWTHENATVVQMDFLLGWNKSGNAKIRAYSWVSQLVVTMPILNAGLGLNAKFCVYL